jgi:membrane-bound metal-dependent hydrolase YbcI (DUF457 family)
MPLPIAHSLLGASVVALLHPQFKKNNAFPLFVGLVLANAADFDFALVFLFGSYEWHRGFSHSILFAVIVWLTISAANKFLQFREAAAYGLAFASHFFLDYATTKVGGGVELFWFFNTKRFGLRWFGLSEMPSELSILELLGALLLELIIFAPLFVLILYFRRKRIDRIADN